MFNNSGLIMPTIVETNIFVKTKAVLNPIRFGEQPFYKEMVTQISLKNKRGRIKYGLFCFLRETISSHQTTI
ncbi:hypothetical protein M2273_000672 [Mucilaginibacter lappiensis]